MEPSPIRNGGPFSGTGNREEESAGQTESNTCVYKEFGSILGAVNSGVEIGGGGRGGSGPPHFFAMQYQMKTT